MSKTIISIERINEVKPHPNADRLEIIQVLGYQVVVQKGKFQVGDPVWYFPPDILLPAYEAELLGVTNYLKHAVFPGETEKRQCRVAAARLRGVPSHGFCAELSFMDHTGWNGQYGEDYTLTWGAKKYVPPVRLGGGDAEPELWNFLAYTNIENIGRFPDAIPDGTPIVITEKIHGTNCRMGLVRIEEDLYFVAGSHKIRRKENDGLYWHFMSPEIRSMLSHISAQTGSDVIVFGEIFGQGVQDLQYGQQGKSLRVFDISVDGDYLDYSGLRNYCGDFKVPMVPTLYHGPFSAEVVEEHTYGDSEFPVTGKFKGREGCVIRPRREQYSEILGGRMILKSVSADYLGRKGAKDIE